MRSIKKWSFTQVMVFGFLALILVGACILMLPICNANGKWLNFPDALFTSCTCVCVTGLVTVVPAFQFTFLGKLVMLFLIQVGGWGVIVCVTYVLVLKANSELKKTYNKLVASTKSILHFFGIK